MLAAAEPRHPSGAMIRLWMAVGMRTSVERFPANKCELLPMRRSISPYPGTNRTPLARIAGIAYQRIVPRDLLMLRRRAVHGVVVVRHRPMDDLAGVLQCVQTREAALALVLAAPVDARAVRRGLVAEEQKACVVELQASASQRMRIVRDDRTIRVVKLTLIRIGLKRLFSWLHNVLFSD